MIGKKEAAGFVLLGVVVLIAFTIGFALLFVVGAIFVAIRSIASLDVYYKRFMDIYKCLMADVFNLSLRSF
jgi:hypothetical protein